MKVRAASSSVSTLSRYTAFSSPNPYIIFLTTAHTERERGDEREHDRERG
jgi:hypothetical protein